MTPAIALYTNDSINDLVAAGGSAAWVMNRTKADKYDWVVIINGGLAKGAVQHGAAVLVARIADLVRAPARNPNQTRWKVVFGPWVEINVPGAWNKSWQNPVRYTTLEDLGIDPGLTKVDLNSSPHSRQQPSDHDDNPAAPRFRSLTIAEAKAGLAAHYGVGLDGIEIVIRG